MPDNEVPLREESHAPTLKEMFSGIQSTKSVTSTLELKLRHATRGIQTEESDLYMPHLLWQNFPLRSKLTNLLQIQNDISAKWSGEQLPERKWRERSGSIHFRSDSLASW